MNNEYDAQSPDLSLHNEPLSDDEDIQRARQDRIQLERLRNALQLLPDTTKLRDQIELNACHLNNVSSSLSSFIHQVRALVSSKESWSQRTQQTRFLALMCDKIKVELLYIQTQLRTLFTLPPILVAMGSTTADLWDEIITSPAYDDNDRPMCLKKDLLDRRITEDLKSLEDHRSTLERCREEAFLGNREERETFEAQCLSSFHTIVSALQNLTSASDTAATTQTLMTDQHRLLHDHLHSATAELRTSIEAAVRSRKPAEPIRGLDKEMQTVPDRGVDQSTQKWSNVQVTRKTQTTTKQENKRTQTRRARFAEEQTQTATEVKTENSTQTEWLEEVYEVERIVGHRRSLAGIEYRVRWCGYPEECDDWILDSKTDCPEAIKECWESMKKEVPGPPKKRSHDETCEDQGCSKSVFSQEPKRNTPPATEALQESEELGNKAAEDIAVQVEADEEEDDLEREMIEANHEFLEMIDEVGEDDGAPEGDAEAMLAEDVNVEQDIAQDAPRLVNEGQLPEHPDVAVEVEHVPEDAEAPIQRPMEGEDPAAERERTIKQLQEDLRRAVQERNDLEFRLNELERLPSCPERRFHVKDVNRHETKLIRCVFCDATQRHYSDSCMVVMDVESRRIYLAAEGRCDKCLINGCNGGENWRKRETPCYYCGQTRHHAAVCTMPETTQHTRQRILWLRRSYEEAVNKINHRRRRLDQFLADGPRY